MIYLDNAATTLRKPQPVIDAVVAAMTTLGNSARGTHDGSLSASRIIYGTREKLADFFGCPRPDHVVFTCNSTEALNMALCGLLNPGDHVISTDLEHNSVLRPLYRMEAERHVSLSFVPADRHGKLDYSDCVRLIRPETRAVICTHASNLTGNVVDLYRMGQIAKRHGLLFVVDASQTAGVLPIDIERMQIDVLCFTGHKSLMGPQGTGGLYIREEVEIRPFKSGGTGVHSFLKKQPDDYPEHLEAGTLNGHGIAGLLAAVREIQNIGLPAIYEKEHRFMQQFYDGVREIPGIKIYGDFSDPAAVRCPVVSLNIGDMDASEVSDWLQEEYDIITRAGAHCAPLMHQYFQTEKQGMVRFSFSYYNKEEEVLAAVRGVKTIAAAQQ